MRTGGENDELELFKIGVIGETSSLEFVPERSGFNEDLQVEHTSQRWNPERM